MKGVANSMRHSQTASDRTIAITLPRSFAWLAPVEVPSLIRIGSSNDGGYIVPEGLVAQTEVLISLGIGADWRFEKDFCNRNSKILIHAYDHTVSARIFRKQYLLELAAFLAGRTTIARVRRQLKRLQDYQDFFGRLATHFPQRVHDRIDNYSIDICTIFERAGRGSSFAKIDIEGSEYRILEDIAAHSDQVLALVIEFHDTGPLRPVFERSVHLLLESYDIVHVHANNFSPIYRDGLPEALEITFARKDKVTFAQRRAQLHLPELDRPNDPSRPDYRLVIED